MDVVTRQHVFTQKKKILIVKTFLQKLCKALVMFHGVAMEDIYLQEIF